METAERQATSRLPASAKQPASSSLFAFELEYRTQCSVSGAVSYVLSPTAVLSLDIPLSEASNSDEVTQYQTRMAKRARIREHNADAYIGSNVRTLLSVQHLLRPTPA